MSLQLAAFVEKAFCSIYKISVCVNELNSFCRYLIVTLQLPLNIALLMLETVVNKAFICLSLEKFIDEQKP